MIPDKLTPEQEAALEELFHQCDLISVRPLPCEIDWVLAAVSNRAPS
jgi:hypothetical protein